MSPIGVFDSGYGGLTILREFIKQMPNYDFLYLGDNARSPYGTRSFQTVYQYTRQAVKWMFGQGCPLVILACNTASAKALRTIQQHNLPEWGGAQRVLGVIRPTAEIIGNKTKSQKIGILATRGTVLSDSYPLEIKKFFPDVQIYQQACPLWVPLIENGRMHSPGAAFFFKEDILSLMQQDADIDTVLLGCTHYPLIIDEIQKYLSPGIALLSQGPIVAGSLANYLIRHPEINMKCSKGGLIRFCTTDDVADFNRHSTLFFGENVEAIQMDWY